MKRGNWIIQLIFGILGGVYAVVGVGFLAYAVHMVGALERIYSLPEDDLAFAVVGTVFTLMGVIFLLVTGILFLISRKQQRLREELLTYGTRVTGVVTEAYMDRSVRVNRRSPYRAKVRCTLPLGETTLRTPMLWDRVPTVGEKVTGIYDPMDEKKHVIAFEGEI